VSAVKDLKTTVTNWVCCLLFTSYSNCASLLRI